MSKAGGWKLEDKLPGNNLLVEYRHYLQLRIKKPEFRINEEFRNNSDASGQAPTKK